LINQLKGDFVHSKQERHDIKRNVCLKKEQQDIKRKLKVFAVAEASGNIALTCRRFGISRAAYYKWRRKYKQLGEPGLINQKPCPQNPSIRVKPEIEEKILDLRQNQQLGPRRISWYMQRYFGLNVSECGVRGVLLRHGLNRLPRPVSNKRNPKPFIRYEKQVPGHHVQVDVKFLFFRDQEGRRLRRFQYTAIDDATRIRALKIYDRHTQSNAIDFINYVTDLFPFRIKVIRTDNGHEFKTRFNWHVQDMGMIHTYIRPSTPRLNGKVERSHLTDKQEFYQLLEYKDDVDLEQKVKQWENYYNFLRPHTAHKGLSPYEMLKKKLLLDKILYDNL
jgi:transposase InsO family protein